MLDEAKRTSFDRKAAQYDRARPSYPTALFDHVLALTGAKTLLEIGAGPGKATVPFAARGCRITALEPGAALAGVLRANAPSITVVESRFEDFVAEHPFDLVYAAQSMHWVEPAHRYVKSAALAPWIALIRNDHRFPDPIRRELDAVYAALMPDPHPPDDDPVARSREMWVGELDASGLYGPVEVATFPWGARYTRAQYLELVDTYSDHATLPDAHRLPLYAALGEVIDRHGGAFELPYVASVFVARRR